MAVKHSEGDRIHEDLPTEATATEDHPGAEGRRWHLHEFPVGLGWQVFVEAMAVKHSEGDRIHLVFGPAEGSEARLEVGSDGTFKVTTSLGQNGLDVRVRRFSDRWRAEIDVPESWLANSITDSEAGSVLIGFRRDGPGTLVSYAGPPPPTWRREIPVRPFAIADWDRPRPPGAGDSR